MIRKILVTARHPGILKWFLMDFIDNHGRSSIAFGFFVVSMVMRFVGQKRLSIRFLMSAHRISNGKSCFIHKAIINNKSDVLLESLRRINERSIDPRSLEMAIGRTIILKKPEKKGGVVAEKGVLLITFTDSCGVLFKEFNFESVGADYHIVLEPSWAGYCLPEVLVWAALSHPVIIESTEPLDYSFVKDFSDNLHPIGIGASNWVDSRFFYPLEGEQKKYDVVYVTNYNRIKRHHVFFRAIARARKIDPKYRAAIAFGAAGSDRDLIYSLIDYYNVRDFLDIYENLDKAKLNVLLNRSRCNVLLSLKEGSNRSIFESMFADVPVLVLSKNIGLRKDYINKYTGFLCDDDTLASRLIEIKCHAYDWKPEEWAQKNISPKISTNMLVDHIKKISGDSDWASSSEVLVKVNRPEVEYFNGVSCDPELNVQAVLSQYRH